MKFTRSLAFVSLVLASLLAGCDSDPPAVTPQQDLGPTPPQTDGQLPVENYSLTIVGPSSFTLSPQQQATLRVAYMKNEELLPGKTITFTVKGDAKDSAFTTFTALTNNVGEAQTVVLAGQAPTTFEVEASAARAAPVTFHIQVINAPPAPPRLAGAFTLVSNFDVTTKFDGTTLGDVLNVLEEMSNHSDDPGRYIVDIVLAEAFKGGIDPTVQSIVNALKPTLYTAVQNLLMKYVPGLVSSVKSLAKNLSDLARRFQVTSTMTSAVEQPIDKPMVVSHKLEKIGWTLNGITKHYGYADLGLQHPQVDQVQLMMGSTTGLSVSEHSFPLQFGSFLLVGLNQLVIPLINPSATSFGGLLAGWIDCVQVGKTINDNTNNLLGEATWKSACDAALKAVGVVIEQQITKINVGTSSITLAGTCQITDQNNDTYLDTMSGGLWTGTFVLGGNSAPISGPGNNFTGTRTK